MIRFTLAPFEEFIDFFFRVKFYDVEGNDLFYDNENGVSTLPDPILPAEMYATYSSIYGEYAWVYSYCNNLDVNCYEHKPFFVIYEAPFEFDTDNMPNVGMRHFDWKGYSGYGYTVDYLLNGEWVGAVTGSVDGYSGTNYVQLIPPPIVINNFWINKVRTLEEKTNGI